jgi:hypothetical protein
MITYRRYFVSNVRSPMLEKLAEGMPHSLLLENADHDLFILVAAAKPGEPVSGGASHRSMATFMRRVSHLSHSRFSWWQSSHR